MNFDNCVPKSSIHELDERFKAALIQIEFSVGHELEINSALRSVNWEHTHGRSGTSSHCKGIAADIKALTPRDKFMIIQAAIGAGINRIGVYKTFIHVDMDKVKQQCVIWYGE